MHYSYVSASHDFTHLAWQLLFLSATCVDSEPFHFASKSVEFLHTSLYVLPVISCQKTLFGVLEMHYSYLSACP